MDEKSSPSFVVCVHNESVPASLEIRKIYQVVPDVGATDGGYLRVLDESGEDYLYPREYFAPIELSESLKDALRLAG
ncbi:MAG TPA: hypothetical protein VHU81_01565 [Thermoanaerobaculia bacterium]|jgi:hypothetical protein|nr:hypothetical protein [Thermoanaerobaculia bacterium]